MILDYIGVKEINGSLIVLDDVQDASFEEIVTIRLENGSLRQGRVVQMEGNRVVVQVFQGTRGISLDNTRTRLMGRPMELPLSPEILGRVFDGAGRPIDGLGDIFPVKRANINGTPSAYAENKAQTMMMYDYVQTQTKAGFDQDTSKYNFAPIITPVSQWDVDDDGEKDTTMRFTESWRSVKNTGFAIPRVNVENNPQKLKALLEFIDYMFSNDGQILMTFGSQASGADKLDGWWYATEAADVQLATVAEQVEGSEQYTVKAEYASQYFIYKNKVYVGTSYKGTQIPTLTNATLKLFEGETVQTANGSSIALTQADLNLANTVNNYTDFARGLIGAALPIGNKNQGFEFQCTAQCGLDGAAIVGNGLANGTIKHTTVTIDANNLWYTLVPTTLPYSNTDATAIKTNYTDITTGLFGNGSKIYKNAYLDILYYGYGYMA